MVKWSSFYGIDVVMRSERNERRHRAHFHAKYSRWTAVFDVKSREIIKQGKRPFSTDQANMVRSWIAIHEQELMDNWESLNESGVYFKIAPLH